MVQLQLKLRAAQGLVSPADFLYLVQLLSAFASARVWSGPRLFPGLVSQRRVVSIIYHAKMKNCAWKYQYLVNDLSISTPVRASQRRPPYHYCLACNPAAERCRASFWNSSRSKRGARDTHRRVIHGWIVLQDIFIVSNAKWPGLVDWRVILLGTDRYTANGMSHNMLLRTTAACPVDNFVGNLDVQRQRHESPPSYSSSERLVPRYRLQIRCVCSYFE